jgi:histidine triad (HIT) family protein
MVDDCIFCKLINGELPSFKVYEDDNAFAFMDIMPATKGHVLVIPKEHHETFLEIPSELMGKYMMAVQRVASAVVKAVGARGYKVESFNKYYAGQTVNHMHFHVIPRYEGDGMQYHAGKGWWVPQKDLYEEGEIADFAARIRGFTGQ